MSEIANPFSSMTAEEFQNMLTEADIKWTHSKGEGFIYYEDEDIIETPNGKFTPEEYSIHVGRDIRKELELLNKED